MSYTYSYPRPALAVDCVVFGWDGQHLQVLLIERGGDPFKGSWALPGGFVGIEESLDTAALRELKEETGVEALYLEQLYTMGEPGRDPRGRVVSVAYYALVKPESYTLRADSDASAAKWFPLAALPELAFDHAEIIRIARERLQGKVTYRPVGFELLPDKFALSQLQELYEAILAQKMDKRNFRKKFMSMGLLEELDEFQADVPHRAAKLFRFKASEYRKLEQQGFQFKI